MRVHRHGVVLAATAAKNHKTLRLHVFSDQHAPVANHLDRDAAGFFHAPMQIADDAPMTRLVTRFGGTCAHECWDDAEGEQHFFIGRMLIAC